MGVNLIGHSFAGRLTSVEDQLVRELSMNNTKPKDILSTIKLSFSVNESTLKIIYNARQKHRVFEHGGRTQLQFLLGKLELENYYYLARRCDKTDSVNDMFYAHLTSVELLRAFPCVLLMDCTYKMNRYRMPLVEVVGVTSTNLTFSVAFMYLSHEREDNYRWALTILKGLMNDGCTPKVILTDRELVVMNVISATFPDSKSLLCRWHINKNVLSNCKPIFGRNEKWEQFNHSWNMLILAEDEHIFNELVRRLETDYRKYPRVVTYVMNNWIQPYKEKFVSCWTDNIMHFDNTSTSRAESTHAKLKKQLGSSQGNFTTSWERIHHLLITSHTNVKASFEQSLHVAPHRYASPLFKNIRGLVSHHALGKMFNEMSGVDRCGVDPLICGCVLRRTCGLPCAHELGELIWDGQVVQLDMIDYFWRKLDCEPAKCEGSVNVDVGNCWVETVGDINDISERPQILRSC